jgi:PBP1b-binding outer membrane lipoprotein LpoB
MRKQLYQAAIALLLLGGSAIPVTAQQTPTNPGVEVNPAAAPDLKLTAAQRQMIYSSISNQKQKETAPPTFRAAVGMAVPTSIETQAMPKTIVDMIPQLKGYEYAMVANQVLLVDPKNKQVVEIIN